MIGAVIAENKTRKTHFMTSPYQIQTKNEREACVSAVQKIL